MDDLTREAVGKLEVEGFEPCAVIETSKDNFHAWLKHSRVLSKSLGTLAAQTLARRFAADPSAADWRRFGRLSGFTNRKPQHRRPDGLFPFVKLPSDNGKTFATAETFDGTIVRLSERQEQDRNARRQHFKAGGNFAYGLCLSRFREAPKYQGRPAAADMAFSIAAFAQGWQPDRIAEALAREYLSRDPSRSRRLAYVRRTTAKALQWAIR